MNRQSLHIMLSHPPPPTQATGIDEQTLLHVVPVVRAAVEDRSWRVRQAIAKVRCCPIRMCLWKVWVSERMVSCRMRQLRHVLVTPPPLPSIHLPSFPLRPHQTTQNYAEIAVAVKGEGGQRATEALLHDLLPGLVALLQARVSLCCMCVLYVRMYARMCGLVALQQVHTRQLSPINNTTHFRRKHSQIPFPHLPPPLNTQNHTHNPSLPPNSPTKPSGQRGRGQNTHTHNSIQPSSPKTLTYPFPSP